MLYQSVTVQSVFMDQYKQRVFSNNIKQLIFVMVECGALFKVRTEFLNVI
jgi:hypothetical protein